MPNALDVLTFDEAKAAVNLSPNRTSEQDSMLEIGTSAVSQLLDRRCGPVVIRTVTDEVHYAPTSSVLPSYWPVVSVASVTEYVSGAGTVLTAAGIDVSDGYLLSGGVIRRQSNWDSANFSGHVKITYDAGRYATTETVDGLFKKAAAEILQGNWSKFSAVWARGGDPLADPQFFDEVEHVLTRWLGDELHNSQAA